MPHPNTQISTMFLFWNSYLFETSSVIGQDQVTIIWRTTFFNRLTEEINIGLTSLKCFNFSSSTSSPMYCVPERYAFSFNFFSSLGQPNIDSSYHLQGPAIRRTILYYTNAHTYAKHSANIRYKSPKGLIFSKMGKERLDPTRRLSIEIRKIRLVSSSHFEHS